MDTVFQFLKAITGLRLKQLLRKKNCEKIMVCRVLQVSARRDREGDLQCCHGKMRRRRSLSCVICKSSTFHG